MNPSEKTGVLRIYIGDSDKVNGKHLSEEIVLKARNSGMAGATVFKGIMSFGSSHSIHTLKIFALSSDLPVVIELIDNIEKLDEFVETVNQLLEKSGKGGLVTFQEINVIKYKRGKKYKGIKN